MSAFSPDERERYARHILLKEIGGAGQQRLKAASIALIGAGGLGAPAALYLAAAGVGRLILIDDDTVSLSNLQRQVLYETGDVGAAKVARAEKRLSALNPHVDIEARAERLNDANAQALLHDADIVLDGCDSYATRYSVNTACHALGLPLISGAVGRWAGQLATFKSGLTKGRAIDARLPCYTCLVPELPPTEEKCSEVGIVGALTGVIGAMMALEAIKEVAQAGESLAGRLLIYDGLSASSRIVTLPPDPHCPTCARLP
ncbi:MAG: molybdopterin-synthase adenylyltransferase MoeB [Alphaproteobacteria bacterium]|nr:molybdopterin-synthase adenylyltransferase MoeB [Alphaproteobacteria bacterium]